MIIEGGGVLLVASGPAGTVTTAPSCCRCWTRSPGVEPVWPAPHRLEQLYADRGYDHDGYRRQVRIRGIKPVTVRRDSPHSFGLGRHRWVGEQTLAGGTGAAGHRSAERPAMTSTRRSSPSAAPSSATNTSTAHSVKSAKSGRTALLRPLQPL